MSSAAPAIPYRPHTLALSFGATPAESTEIANHASGIVVGKLGTATVTADELLASFAE